MVHSTFAKKEAALQQRLVDAESAVARWQAAADVSASAQTAAEQAAAGCSPPPPPPPPPPWCKETCRAARHDVHRDTASLEAARECKVARLPVIYINMTVGHRDRPTYLLSCSKHAA